MAEFFFEIGTEEIPSSYIRPATEALKTGMADFFSKSNIACDNITTFATPRRIAISITGLPAERPKRTVKNFGPPAQAGFRNGEPTKAATGFAKSKGVEVSALKIEATDKGDYICVETEEGGEGLGPLLTEELPKIITGLPFPKSMSWGEGEYTFTRPVHWLVALFDGVALPITIAGVTAGNETRGHRFLSPDSITVTGRDDYESRLEKAFVIADSAKRKELVVTKATSVAKKNGAQLRFDDDLAETIAFLTEWPVALYGEFDTEFLDLPDQLLIASMKDHQKMFAVTDKSGKLTNGFVGVSNMIVRDNAVVRDGYRRVLRARLKDALFFLEADTKKSLDSFVAKLTSVTYQKKLGTVGEKVDRVASLARWIAREVAPGLADKAERAAQLCKADLESLMVYEFPELQGIMGKEYALAAGVDEEIAHAIERHYWPLSAGDTRVPDTLGAIVSIADRIDTIVGIFGIGQSPTGSKDPFALRRHTIAIIFILGNMKGWRLSLRRLIVTALHHLDKKITLSPAETQQAVLDFFSLRIKNGYTGPRNIPGDIVDAVLAAGFDDINDTDQRIEALNDLKSKPFFDSLAVTFKRVANITKDHDAGDIDTSLFEDAIESELNAAVDVVASDVDGLIATQKYLAALEKIATLRNPVDQFFLDVLVMAEDEKVKNNRLNLLARIAALLNPIADFSKIVSA